MARDTTHEYRCVGCGLTLKGRTRADGQVVASNGPPSGETRDCLCWDCEPQEVKQ